MSSHRSTDSGRKSSRKTTTVSTPSPYSPGQPYVTTQYNGWPATAPVSRQAGGGQQYTHQPSSSTSTPYPVYTDNSSQPSWNSSTGSQGGIQYGDPVRDADVAYSRQQCAEYARNLPATTQLPSSYRINHQEQIADFDQRFQGQPSTATQPYQPSSQYAPTLDIDFGPSQSQSQSQSQSRRDDRRGGSSVSGSKHHSSSSRRHK
ncbi:hypothetical protein CCUS01_03805 [Colletotrichum cuscutae]|uniref:Uncharacterized protein n=1 Tax=Colletotrichum cuscutae TaxID=1209917 RepID=A0AAI9VGM9_9PEZI|nr:hypothetical protein CCUS01_03805 [Colletotrichum cuscutae]